MLSRQADFPGQTNRRGEGDRLQGGRMRSVLPRGLGRTPVQLLLSSYKLYQPLLFRCTVDGLRRSWGERKRKKTLTF